MSLLLAYAWMTLACIDSRAASSEAAPPPLVIPQDSMNLNKSLGVQWAQYKDNASASPAHDNGAESRATKVAALPCEGATWRGIGLSVEDFKSLSDEEQLILIKSMHELENTCLKSATYYAELGQWQLLAHQAKDALEALERSLLIEPEQPSVQLDFALALAEAGDGVSARALVDQILLRPDLPHALRATLEQLKGADQGSKSLIAKELEYPNSNLSEGWFNLETVKKHELHFAGYDWQGLGSGQILYGHDTNLNSASFVNTINLTLPNATVPLPLDAQSLPQSGSTQISAAQFLAQTPFGEGSLSLGASWIGRVTPSNSALGFNMEEFSLQLRPDKDLGLQQRLVLNHFEFGGSDFYNGLTYLMWRESEVRPWFQVPWTQTLECRFKVGGEAERRTFAQDPSQNGLFGGLMLGGFCGNHQDQFNLSWIGGLDWESDGSRAGGNQKRQELKASWVHARQNSKLSLEWSEQWLVDTQIYSDLLGGINRNTLRKSIRLSYEYKISNKLGRMFNVPNWISYWESQRYSSSVDLFNLRGDSVQTGLKWDF